MILWPLACIACYWFGYVVAHAYPNQKLLDYKEHRKQLRLGSKKNNFWLNVQNKKKKMNLDETMEFIMREISKR